MDEIDLEIIKARKRIKDLKKVNKMRKKYKRLERQAFKPPVHVFVSDIVSDVCLTFKNIVKW